MANPFRSRPANTTTQQQHAAARPKSSLLRILIFAILGLIVIVGLAVLIAWLIVKPKRLIYTVEGASIRNFNINSDHVNSSFSFAIRAYNPNKRMSVYYDAVEVSTAFDGQTVAFNTLSPFHQPKRNVTVLEAQLESRDVALSKSLSKDVRAQRADGQVKVNLRIRARIRFKVGAIKLRHQTVKALCPAVPISFHSGKSFQITECDLDY
ncbi:unnamed protein product [Linum trigynum]|uniref:Late embryogenesis abundant protein LEA-2 subgroup domain-containing protein n=1 Tax=Linum trigynum TaxID=586398 RepID=A0AAV2G0J3_9ROSI